MITLKALKKIEVSVSDIMDAAQTIPTNGACTCDWIDGQWVSPEQYMEWAEVSLKGKDNRRLVSTVAHAKRAVCRVIDTLILSYHLEYAKRCSYPAKIEGLKSIGIGVESIVQELIIDPRDDLEYKYRVPESERAKHAIQVAGLFVAAMRHEFERKPIIGFDWNVQFMHSQTKTEDVAEFRGFQMKPMFFIDVFEEQTEVKIVDPRASEVRCARLNDLSMYDCFELGMYLRSHYTHSNRRETDMPKTVYEALKSQAGF
jgi:hypothetical protein